MRERSDRGHHQPLTVIESAYRVDLPLADWLDEVALAMSKALDGEPRGITSLFDATRSDWVEMSNIRTPGFPEWLKSAILPGRVPDEIQRKAVQLFQRGAFGSFYELIDPIAPQISALFRGCGANQVAGVIATDPTFRGCMVGVVTRDARYSQRTHYRWRKVGAHLSAGLRLRRTLASLSQERSNVVDQAEAVVATNGKVEHATGPATSAAARSALQEALVRIDAARGEPTEQSVDLWAGLVAGRWSLVEHYERTGRRYFLAYRNDPELARVRRLTEREVQVCTYAALGYSNKLIAYTLGLRTPTVARYLERARGKLGGKAALEALQALQAATPEDEASSDRDPMFEN